VPAACADRAASISVSSPLLIKAAVLIHIAPAPPAKALGHPGAAPMAGPAPTASNTLALRLAAT